MRPKVILQLYPMLPADGEEGRIVRVSEAMREKNR